MIDEQICLQNLQRIVSEVDKEQKFAGLPLNLLQSAYQKIADNVFRVSAMNVIKFKSMLWNFDNLRPEIRSRFQKEFFDRWRFIYLELADKNESKEHIETNRIKIDVNTAKPDIGVEIDETDIGSEIDSIAIAQTDIHVFEDAAVQKDNPPITMGFSLSGHGYKKDWFHKLLDFVAAIVGH